MEHGLELIIPRLEIFGNLIFSIFSYPGNIGNRVFLIAWYPGNIGNWIFLVFWYPRDIGYWIFWFSGILVILDICFLGFLVAWKYWRSGFSDCLVSWKYGRRAGGGGRAAPGVVLCCLGLFLEHVSWNFRISWKYWKYCFSIFWDFSKKDARRNFTQDAPTDEPRSLI